MHFIVSAWTPAGGSHAGRSVTKGRRRCSAWGAALCIGFSLTLGGCDYVNNALWPSLTGPNPTSSSKSSTSSQAPARSSQDISGDTSAHAMSAQLSERDEQLSRMAASNAQASNASSSSSYAQLPAGGTEVGRRANQLASDAQKLDGSVAAQANAVQQLRAQTVQSAEAYQGLVAQINARLQVGTTPGNPILQAQWDQANTALDNFAAQIGRMSEVSNQVAADASTAAFLLESVRAAYS